MSGSLIDANVLLDIATGDPNWATWSQEQIRAAAGRGAVYINPIIYAELAPAFATKDELDRWLDPSLFQRAPLPYDAAGSRRRRLSNIAAAEACEALRSLTFTLARRPRSNS